LDNAKGRRSRRLLQEEVSLSCKKSSNSHLITLSKQIQDSLVSVVAQEIDHALRNLVSFYPFPKIRVPRTWNLCATYLWHDSFAVLALDILERHLDALGRRHLNAGTVDVGDFGERDF
jgi:hypothetical protein